MGSKPYGKKGIIEGNKIFRGIAVRLTAIAVGALILLGVIVIACSTINTKKCISERERESLRNTAYTLKNAYYVLYNGNFQELQNDMELINGKSQLVETNASSNGTVSTDAVSSATKEKVNAMTIMETLNEQLDIDISIFWGDKRIATSFVDESGLRKVGTNIDDEVKRKVIEQSEEYFNDNLIEEGHSHNAYYIPISNDSEVVGVIGVAKDSELINRQVRSTVGKLLILEIIITLLSSILLFFIVRRISNYIKQASKTLQVIAEGDLTIEVDDKLLNRNDEIGLLGKSTVKLRDEIKEMLKDIKYSIVTLGNFANELNQSTDKTKLTVDDVAKTIENITMGVSLQAENTREANTSIMEVGNEIQNITTAVNVLKTKSEDISKASFQANEIADELEISANNTMKAVEKIATQTKNTNTATEDIKSALNVITDIAHKTNLLSLNASIEAARAGEHGKGFSIVAEEIKILAEQSAKSAEEIATIIGHLLDESKKSLDVVTDVKETINDQKYKLDDTRKQFAVVRDGVDESRKSIESIYERILILDKQKESLIETINSLSFVSEENAACMEETTVSTTDLNVTIGNIAGKVTELRNMAQVLKKSIKLFKLSD